MIMNLTTEAKSKSKKRTNATKHLPKDLTGYILFLNASPEEMTTARQTRSETGSNAGFGSIASRHLMA
jgi:hypothetical protein